MRISFTPKRTDVALSLQCPAADRLSINGEVFSFEVLPDGATIPAGEVPCDWVAGPVERVNGEIHLTLILPHGPNPSQAVAFPEPIVVSEVGPIAIPQDTDSTEAAHVDS